LITGGKKAEDVARAGDVVIGPRGGKGRLTGHTTADGRPIIQRKSGGYYTVDATTGKQVRVNSPKNLFDLSKVTPPKGKTFEGTVHRYENPDRIDGTWKQNEYNVDANHRYTGEGQGGVYAGTTQETALKEVNYEKPLGDKIPVHRKVKLNNVLNLTDPKVREQIGVTEKDITQTGKGKYTKTQQIGKWAKEHGYDGILAPSARNPSGSNIVILKE